MPDFRYLPGRMVEFAAPAAECWRCLGKDRGHRVMTGSSFAAAWLSGMLADYFPYPDIDPVLAKSLLRRVAAEGK